MTDPSAADSSAADPSAADSSPAQIERELEATRQRLAGTIDELLHRSHPKTIARREVATLKGYVVDSATGQPRTENILKVTGVVVGLVALIVVVRKVAR